MTFQIGDVIECVNAESTNWYENGDVHVVRGEPFVTRLRSKDSEELVVHVERHTSDNIFVVCDAFKLVSTGTTRDDLDIGDTVEIVCLSKDFLSVFPEAADSIGARGKVVRFGGMSVLVEFEDGDNWYMHYNSLRVVEPAPETPSLTSQFVVTGGQVYIDNTIIKDGDFSLNDVTPGIARPILETRKVDKIRMELFDDGFPNAVLEVAKVMTWAQKAKGYKDHDWHNLPNPENALKGAGSRHRRDANSQKMKGVPASERVDHESNLHHLAHQAFNVLAELELILTGKIV